MSALSDKALYITCAVISTASLYQVASVVLWSLEVQQRYVAL